MRNHAEEGGLVRELLERAMSVDGEGVLATPLRDLSVHKSTRTSDRGYHMLGPSVLAILSGTQRLVVGDDDLTVRRGEFFVSPAEIPVALQTQLSPAGDPFVGLVLRLDRRMVTDVAALMLNANGAVTQAEQAPVADKVGALTLPILRSVARMAGLLESPHDAPILGAFALQEVIYRLLESDQGHRIRLLLRDTRPDHPVMQAVRWLNENAEFNVSIDDLAAEVAMSPSALHRHFRELTGMSPVQYRNRIRLGRARELMIFENLSTAASAFAVGYRSVSQFSRDYRRFYGAPPYRDAKRAWKR